MGDLNAHHEVWGGRNWQDQRGKMLENIIVTGELDILSNGSPTHISGTSVYITIAAPNVAPDMQWTVLPLVLSSDHYPIVIIMTTAGTSENQSEERHNIKKCNWIRYREDSQWKKERLEYQNADEAVKDLFEELEYMTDKDVPKYRQRRYYAKP